MKNTYKAIVILLTLGYMLAASSGAAASGWPEWTVAFVAHRGGIVPGYPENTIAAFRQAIKHGTEVIASSFPLLPNDDPAILSSACW